MAAPRQFLRPLRDDLAARRPDLPPPAQCRARRTRTGPEVTNALFDGFDEALRDIGTGDLTVGKKIRKMGEAYYGADQGV